MSYPGAYNIHDDLFGAKSYGKLEENGLTLNYEKCKVGIDKMVYMETYCLEMVYNSQKNESKLLSMRQSPITNQKFEVFLVHRSSAQSLSRILQPCQVRYGISRGEISCGEREKVELFAKSKKG